MNLAVRIFSKTYVVAITLLGLIILTPLAIVNAYSTCFVNKHEHVLFTKDSIVLNLVVVAIVLAVMVFARKNKYVLSFINRVNTDEAFYKKCRNILLVVIFAISCVWVLATQPNPGADQKYVQEAVLDLKKHDYSAFKQGGYVSEYPNQIGIIVISYFFSLIFGDLNYIAIQIANAFGVALFYKAVTDIQKEFGLGRIERLVTAFCGILFLPLILYSAFVYGTVMGLLFSTLAFKYEVKFFKDYKLKDIFWCSLFIAIAIMLKNNYLITFVGVFIFAFVEVVANKKFRKIWCLALLVFMLMAQSLIPRTVLENITNEELDKGSSSWSWIAMGLQECSLAEGWYNGFNAGSYRRAEYDPKEQEVEAKESIASRLDEFSGDAEYAAKFFSRKIASMWNEPTYQSVWITQIRSTDIEQSEFVFHVLSENGSHTLALFLNFFQFAVYFGSVLYLFLCRNRKYYRQSLILLVVFIGGFMFHIAWEAKGQYSITYFVLLIPYAVAGFMQASGKIAAAIKKKETETDRETKGETETGNDTETKGETGNDIEIKTKAETDVNEKFTMDKIWEVSSLSFVMFLIVFVITGISVICGFKYNWEPLRDDTEEYEEYIEKQKLLNGYNIEDGEYYIKSSSTGMFMGKEETGNGFSCKLEVTDVPQKVEIHTRKGISYISFTDGDWFIDEYDASDEMNQKVDSRQFSGSIGQSWQVIPKEGMENAFIIVHDSDYALTYNQQSGEFYVTLNNEIPGQVWIFVKADE